MTRSHYSERFFNTNAHGAIAGAERILPWVIARLKPRSIVDFGCGVGAWLEIARQHGIVDLLGIEGEWAAERRRKNVEYLFTDLEEPVLLGRTFDLALCLEVAEHLSNARSVGLVRDLTRAAPRVLFSAAIPGQIGVRHINERWPSFWENLFRDEQYICLDVIRPVFWNDAAIPCWYRQNLVLYVRADLFDETAARFDPPIPTSLRDVVHPETLAYFTRNYKNTSVRFLARLLLNRLGFSR